ncbi:MAG: phosphoribosyltransferase family protein [Patescibacteria group bacterium]
MKKVLYRFNSFYHSLISTILDLVFPEECLGCGSPGINLCQTCISSAPRIGKETKEGIYACFDYRDPIIKKAIWSLKYYRKRSLGQKLGKVLHDCFSAEISTIERQSQGNTIFIIPVPLSSRRERTRGYNQAEAIARGFCASLPDSALAVRTDIILKHKDTSAQARTARRAERLRNLEGAFRIKNAKGLRGATIIIIDDVTTTGGTVTEIRKVLLNDAHAKQVIAFAVAH